jgi:solute carrier family 25 phosphate transporter 23/24/25/41
MKSVDTNGDGRISYNGQTLQLPYRNHADQVGAEFRTFVHETETELLALFKSIDIDRNGKISREELQVAFSRAGLAVPNSKLDVFFSEVDADNDGAISFEEWRYVSTCSAAPPTSAPNGCWAGPFTFTTSYARADFDSDFLLFIPATAPDLRQVMSYYQETHHINPEGDVLLSDDTISGLGIHFLHSLFGSIFLVARTPPFSASAHAESFDSLDMAAPAEDAFPTASQTLPPRYDSGDLSASVRAEQKVLVHDIASVLIGCFPDIEYFVAGGIAGIGMLPRGLCTQRKSLSCTYLQSLVPRPHLSIASKYISSPRPTSPRRRYTLPSLDMSSERPWTRGVHSLEL